MNLGELLKWGSWAENRLGLELLGLEPINCSLWPGLESRSSDLINLRLEPDGFGCSGLGSLDELTGIKQDNG